MIVVCIMLQVFIVVVLKQRLQMSHSDDAKLKAVHEQQVAKDLKQDRHGRFPGTVAAFAYSDLRE